VLHEGSSIGEGDRLGGQIVPVLATVAVTTRSRSFVMSQQSPAPVISTGAHDRLPTVPKTAPLLGTSYPSAQRTRLVGLRTSLKAGHYLADRSWSGPQER